MKTRLNAIFFTIMLVMISCSSNENAISDGPVYISADVELSYVNAFGENLLAESTPNYYPIDGMKLSYLVNDEIVDARTTGIPRDGGSGVELREGNKLFVFLNTNLSNVISENGNERVVENIAYLQLSANETDTIRSYATVLNDGQSFITTKVWYNNQLVRDEEAIEVIIVK